MAQFKISLMSFVNNMKNKDNTRSSGVLYTIDTMSDFHTQPTEQPTESENILESNHKVTKTYTYNEKLSLHQNGQKELTFNMDAKLIENLQQVENPFISHIHIGSNILLEDKYENQYMFSVSKIDFSFHSANIVYTITCQDFFSYTLAKQNQGYEIENDPSKDTFIGAKTIDWWTNKIANDCKIGYEYIPFNVGVYINTNQDAVKFTDEAALVDVDRIIKPIYSEKDYPDYQVPLTFSISDSTANAALIALGQKLDLQLATFEWQRQWNNSVAEFDEFFWFEPTKNPEVSGLTYSPSSDVKTFSLSFNGDSLSTVMNVESQEVGEELVSLLPKTPGFFLDIFSQETAWRNTEYYKGMFQDLCSRQNFSFRYGDAIQISVSDGKLLLPQGAFASLKPYYNILKFSSNDLNSPATISLDRSGEVYMYTSYIDDFVLSVGEEEFRFGQKLTIEELNTILSAQSVFIKINDEAFDVTTDSITSYDLCISFERVATTEELEYAKIADSIPWLENRLIDFSYFIEHNLITPYEYKQLQDKITNKLRITNGILNYWYNDYYTSLHSKTQQLATLTEKVDNLGAAIQNDILSQYAASGTITSIDSIKNRVQALKVASNTTSEGAAKSKTGLLSFNSTYQKYAKDYIAAQLRFYKNVYNFRQYFNAQNVFISNDTKMYNYTYRLKPSVDSDNLFVFDNTITYTQTYDSTKVNDDLLTMLTFYDSQNGGAQVKIVDNEEATKYYKKVEADAFTKITQNEPYKPYRKYYKKVGDSYVALSKQDLINIYVDNLDANNDYALKVPAYKSIGNKVNDIYSKAQEFAGSDWVVAWILMLHILDASDFNVLGSDSDLQKVLKLKYTPFTQEYRIKENGELIDNYVAKNYLDYDITEHDIVTIDNYNLYYYNSVNSKAYTYVNGKKVWFPVGEQLGQSGYLGQSLTGSDRPMTQQSQYIDGYPTKDNYDNLIGYNEYYYTRNSKDKTVTDDYLLSIFNLHSYSGNEFAGVGEEKLNNHFYKPRYIRLAQYFVNNGIDLTTIKTTPKMLMVTEAWLNAHANEDILNNKIDIVLQEPILSNTIKDVPAFENNNLGTSISIAATYLGFTTSSEPNDKGFCLGDDGNYYTLVIEEDFEEVDVVPNDPDIHNLLSHFEIYNKNTYKTVDLTELSDFILGASEDYYYLSNWTENGYVAAGYNDTNIQLYEDLGDNVYYPVFTKDFFKSSSGNSRFYYYSNFKYTEKDIATSAKTSTSLVLKKINYIESTKYLLTINELIDGNLPAIGEELQVSFSNGSDKVTISGTIYSLGLDTDRVVARLEVEYNPLLDRVRPSNGYGVTLVWALSTDYKCSFSTPSISYGINSITTKRPSIQSSDKAYTVELQDIDWDENNNSAEKTVSVDMLDEDGQVHSIQVDIVCTYQAETIGKLTNGQFWYKYRDSVIEACQEHAAVIESQLTEYWTVLYNASLYTDYMVPEYWQPYQDGKENFFFNQVVYEDTANETVELSSAILPNIEMVSDGSTTSLQDYNLYYIPADSDPMNVDFNLITKENSISASTAFESNKAMLGIFNRLKLICGDDISNWRCEILPNTKKIYYYPTDGGIRWTDVLNYLAPEKSYSVNIDGWYPVFLNSLCLQYKDRDISGYVKALSEQQSIWKDIYISYPGLILESKYSNEDATTSTELFTLATYAFRDMSRPEKQYNISVIDVNTLKGYYGQEIKVSDSIALQADEYTDNYDDLRTAISQFLYISDISYSLRSDDDIQLTVNTIKYQDKMIQKLAKLIR